jgi:hypothetical protein
MGGLYQLRTKTEQMNGVEFYVDGPHDLWGYMLKSEYKPDATPYAVSGGDWLNLVRGIGSQRPC